MTGPSAAQRARANAKQCRLSRDEVREIRLSMEKTGDIAKRLDVPVHTIDAVRRGTNYGRLLPDEKAAHERRKLPPDERPLAPWHYLIVGDVFMRDGLSLGQDRQEQLDAAWECAHGRLPHDSTSPCGCWKEIEGAAVIVMPEPVGEVSTYAAEEVAA